MLRCLSMTFNVVSNFDECEINLTYIFTYMYRYIVRVSCTQSDLKSVIERDRFNQIKVDSLFRVSDLS